MPSGINFDRFNATALAKGFGPTASDEKKMAQLEDITLEYSYLVSEQLEQQKQLHDAELRNLSRQLKDAQQKAVEGEQWRKKYILAEDAQKSLESKMLPGLEQAKAQAESKLEKVSRSDSPVSCRSNLTYSAFDVDIWPGEKATGRSTYREGHGLGSDGQAQSYGSQARSISKGNRSGKGANRRA